MVSDVIGNLIKILRCEEHPICARLAKELTLFLISSVGICIYNSVTYPS